LVDFAGRVRLTRHFGYPGRVDDFERVWLTAGGVEQVAELILNRVSLGRFVAADGSFEADVTSLLRLRNELSVNVEGGVDGGLWGEVALEVRCCAFLRNIRVETAGRALQITGSVVGSADGPLELYAVLGRRTADYATTTASADGTPFRLNAELPAVADDEDSRFLRVDLVNGASVWYRYEQVCPPPLAAHPEN
jgi:hypothetical protein